MNWTEEVQIDLDRYYNFLTTSRIVLEHGKNSDIINNHFYGMTMDYCKSKQHNYRSDKKTSFNSYVKVIMRNYLFSQQKKMMNDPSYKRDIIKPYLREERLNKILS